MAAEAEPGAGHRDVVGRALARGLDQERKADEVLAVPGREGLQTLDALAGRVDLGLRASRYGSLIARDAGGEALGRELVDARRANAFRQREAAAKSERSCRLRRHDESVRIWIAVSPLREIAVEGGDDGIRLAFLLLRHLALPLADAGAAGVGHNHGTCLAQHRQQAVAFGRGLDGLAARVDYDLCLRLQARCKRFARHRGGRRQVLVRRIGTGAYQADFYLLGKTLLRHACRHLRQRTGGVGRKGAVDVRLQLGEVDLDHPVVILLGMREDLVVRTQVLLVHHGHRGHRRTARGLEIGDHLGVEGEDGASSADFSAHIADGGLACAGNGLGALSEVFYDGVGTAFDGQDTCQFQDNILGGSPSGEASGELDADELGNLELPVHSGHNVYGIGTANADGNHSQTARIGGMRVGSHHHSPGEGIVLQDDLMDDAGARLPEAHPVPRRRSSQEAVHLAVGPAGFREVGLSTLAGADEVVAMYGGRCTDVLPSGVHEL